MLPRAGTWTCSSGRGSTTARGTRTCEFAASSDHLDVLKWAREHDCPWATWTCGQAAGGGYLDMLKWAHEHDCPWDEDTCQFAARGGTPERAQLGAWAPLPVGQVHVYICR
jgi:hypothetical protein